MGSISTDCLKSAGRAWPIPALLKFGEVEPHYMIIVDRVHNLDVMDIQIEMSPRFFSDSIREIEATEKKLRDEVTSATGIAAKITLVEPKSLPRSEGKIRRVQDKRNI